MVNVVARTSLPLFYAPSSPMRLIARYARKSMRYVIWQSFGQGAAAPLPSLLPLRLHCPLYNLLCAGAPPLGALQTAVNRSTKLSNIIHIVYKIGGLVVRTSLPHPLFYKQYRLHYVK